MKAEKIEELLERIELLQLYIEHLGDRIDLFGKLSRADAKAETVPPPIRENRKAKIMAALLEG